MTKAEAEPASRSIVNNQSNAPPPGWDAVRSDFPALHQTVGRNQPVVYLDSASSAQKPRAVIDTEREVEEHYYANAYRGVYEYGARISEEIEASREAVRYLIGAESLEEVVFTSGTTMSINLVAKSWGRRFLSAGDQILLNEMEHHANLVPWQQVAEETGAELAYIPLTDDGRLEMSRLDEFFTEKTKIVAVSGMSNVLGTINPIDELAARAHACGALILIDAAQSIPHGSVDVNRLGVDFLAFSGHKLYGPNGVGVLYGRQELLEAMPPFLGGGHMIATVERDGFTPAELPAKFEAGTLPIVPIIALRTAIDYVDRIGWEAIADHEHRVLTLATDRLSEIPGLTIYGPPVEEKGSIISFTLDGAAAEDLAQLLNRKGVFVRHGHHCTMPLHAHLGVPATVRASFGLYNNEADVDALCAALQFARERLRLN